MYLVPANLPLSALSAVFSSRSSSQISRTWQSDFVPSSGASSHARRTTMILPRWHPQGHWERHRMVALMLCIPRTQAPNSGQFGIQRHCQDLALALPWSREGKHLAVGCNHGVVPLVWLCWSDEDCTEPRAQSLRSYLSLLLVACVICCRNTTRWSETRALLPPLTWRSIPLHFASLLRRLFRYVWIATLSTMWISRTCS